MVYQAFNTSHTNQLDCEEFVCAVAIILEGTLEMKARFLFNMYDTRDFGRSNKLRREVSIG